MRQPSRFAATTPSRRIWRTSAGLDDELSPAPDQIERSFRRLRERVRAVPLQAPDRRGRRRMRTGSRQKKSPSRWRKKRPSRRRGPTPAAVAAGWFAFAPDVLSFARSRARSGCDRQDRDPDGPPPQSPTGIAQQGKRPCAMPSVRWHTQESKRTALGAKIRNRAKTGRLLRRVQAGRRRSSPDRLT